MTFLGWLSDPFKGLSDLHLGDEKGTLNHLEEMFQVFSLPFTVASLATKSTSCPCTRPIPVTTPASHKTYNNTGNGPEKIHQRFHDRSISNADMFIQYIQIPDCYDAQCPACTWAQDQDHCRCSFCYPLLCVQMRCPIGPLSVALRA